MTEAPRSAAVRTARAMVSTSPKPAADGSVAGPNFVLDCLMLIKSAPGATPLKSSA
jgi:hypothetical protein